MKYSLPEEKGFSCEESLRSLLSQVSLSLFLSFLFVCLFVLLRNTESFNAKLDLVGLGLFFFDSYPSSTANEQADLPSFTDLSTKVCSEVWRQLGLRGERVTYQRLEEVMLRHFSIRLPPINNWLIEVRQKKERSKIDLFFL